jgi:hypothetical protein
MLILFNLLHIGRKLKALKTKLLFRGFRKTILLPNGFCNCATLHTTGYGICSFKPLKVTGSRYLQLKDYEYSRFSVSAAVNHGNHRVKESAAL